MKFSKIISKSLAIGLLLNSGLLINSGLLNSFANTLSEDGRYETFKDTNITIEDTLEESKVDAKLLLQVHDELIFDVYQEELQEVMEIVAKGMTTAIKMDVELKAEGSYAVNWYELK